MARLRNSLLFYCGIFCAATTVYVNAQGDNGGRCSLQNGTPGTCRPIKNCPVVQQQIRQGIRPITCSFQGSNPIVCCPSSATPIRITNPRPVTGSGRKKPGETAENWCGNYKKVCVTSPKRKLKPGEFGITVVGGDPAEKDEFPHMAAIGYGKQNSIRWGCGGSLISEKFVLTAAHCLFEQRLGQAEWVRLGAEVIKDEDRNPANSAKKGQTHKVLRRIRHPGYKRPEKYHDVALLEIGPALESGSSSTLTRRLHPACLQVREKKIDKAIATGWGRLNYGDDVTPDLQKVTLSVLGNSVCNRTYEVEIKTTSQLPRGIDSNMMCAGELAGGKDTCVGDSGGPLQTANLDGSCLHQIIGITSFGKICGFENSPGVYTRVTSYLGWIEGHVWPRG